jgi:hypothetical protein
VEALTVSANFCPQIEMLIQKRENFISTSTSKQGEKLNSQVINIKTMLDEYGSVREDNRL